MDKISGIIEFEYFGRLVSIPYEMDNMGGSTQVYFKDKNNHHHSFSHRASTKEWIYFINVEPKWPAEFKSALLSCFDAELERHGVK